MAASGNSEGDDTARLEAALVRIARAGLPPGTAHTALGARLDALIAELRSVLGRDPAE